MCQPKPGKRCASHARKDLARAIAASDALWSTPGVVDRDQVGQVRRDLVRAQAEYDMTQTGRFELAAALTDARRRRDGVTVLDPDPQVAARQRTDAAIEYANLATRQDIASMFDLKIAEAQAVMPDPRTCDRTDPGQRRAWESLGKARYDHAALTADIAVRYLDGFGQTHNHRQALLKEYRTSLQRVRERDIEFRACADAGQQAALSRASAAISEAVDGAAPADREAVMWARRDEHYRQLRVVAGQSEDPTLTAPVAPGVPLTKPSGWEKYPRPVGVSDWASIAHLATTDDTPEVDVRWDSDNKNFVVFGVGSDGMRQLWRAGYRTTDASIVRVTDAPDLTTWAAFKQGD